MVPEAQQGSLELLPDETAAVSSVKPLIETDCPLHIASAMSGTSSSRLGRVQAICDFVHDTPAGFGYETQIQ